MFQTPLFPKTATPITFKQGEAGDCYLLVTLECLMHLSENSLNVIKNMFYEEENGSITVRIKHSSLSKHLNNKSMAEKFIYFFDSQTNEDVFTLTPQRIKDIDEDTLGVQSNSLAIKLLERIVPYYYKKKFYPDNNSLFAHNIKNRFDDTSSTQFISELLGFPSVESKNIEEMIEFKSLFPEYPVYLSMIYLEEYRHALRIKDVSLTSEEIKLINPWDNTQYETYELNSIQSKWPRFCYYIDESNTDDLATNLLKVSHRHKKDVATVLLDVQKNNVPFNLEGLGKIAHFYAKHEQIHLKSIHHLKTMESVIEAATLEKTKDFDCDKDIAKLLVEDGIIEYYINNDVRYLTKSGGLRNYFLAEKPKIESIKKIITEDVFYLTVLAKFLNGDRFPLTETWVPTGLKINESFLHLLKEKIVTTDSAILVSGIESLNKYDPNLGAALIFYFLPRLPEMFPEYKKLFVKEEVSSDLSEKKTIFKP